MPVVEMVTARSNVAFDSARSVRPFAFANSLRASTASCFSRSAFLRCLSASSPKPSDTPVAAAIVEEHGRPHRGQPLVPLGPLHGLLDQPPAGRAEIGSPASQPQVVGQFRGGRVPLVRLLLQALQADQLQVARTVRCHRFRGGRYGRAQRTAASTAQSSRPGERPRPAEHSYRITPSAHTSAGGPTNLVSPVACSGAMYAGVPITACVCVRSPPPPRLASPKSVTFGVPSAVEQHVRRLQVAVDDALLVGRRHPVGDRRHQLGRRRPGGSRPAFEPWSVEVAAGAELQRQERPAVVLAELVHLDHVRVPDRGHRLGLGQEPDERLRVGRRPARTIFRATGRFSPTCRAW